MLKLKFYYPHNSEGWRAWAALLSTGVAANVSASGEFAIEFFCGELSFDYWAHDDQFFTQAAIGKSAYVGLGFDGRGFSLKGAV
jgi:hypothetical protein